MVEVPRILPDDFPEKIYESGIKNANKHDGQRKLYLSELEFLTNNFMRVGHGHTEHATVVVYAGAAPGKHITKLSSQFQDIEFHLFDPREFDTTLDECKNVFKYNQFFDEETAIWCKENFQEKFILFICDIRSTKPNFDLPNEMRKRGCSPEEIKKAMDDDNIKQEKAIHDDMLLQQKWLQCMNPERSLLKFRARYHYTFWQPKKPQEWDTYLSGDLYFQVYAPRNSTELRLLVKQNAQFKLYDSEKIEKQMAYFNQISRRDGYDKLAEAFILRNFKLYQKSLKNSESKQ